MKYTHVDSKSGNAVGLALVFVCALSGIDQALAAVEIHPGNGVATNVTERITGATDVTVNNGTSGGGIVTLNPLNSYHGLTTLGCGSLNVSSLAAAGKASSIGSSGKVLVGSGTFRYTGPDGAYTERPFTNHAASSKASIYDIRNDLTIATDLTQGYGSFVKTGPGTLHLAGTGTNRFNFAGGVVAVTTGGNGATTGVLAPFVPTANGDSPSKGFGGFQLLEGKLVVGENGGLTQIGSATDPRIGGWTETTEQEKDAILEIAGGSFTASGYLFIGMQNGNTQNSPEKMPQSTLRVTGGTAKIPYLSLGRNKIATSAFVNRTAPRLEIFGGTTTISSDLDMADDSGSHSYVLVTNGTLSISGNFQTGRMSGDAYTTNTIEVCGSGILTSSKNFTNNKNIATKILAHDGATMNIAGITVNSGKVFVEIDGATFRSSVSSRNSLLPATLASVKLGVQGVTFAPSVANGGFVIRAAISTKQGVAVDGGVTIAAANANAWVDFGTATQQYTGPTILNSGILGFVDTGALPSDTDFTMTGGTLQITNKTQTVGSVTLGAADTARALPLRVTRGCCLNSTGALTLNGTPSLVVSLYEVKGVANAATTGGTYPLIQAPAASREALEYLATNAVYANPAYTGVTGTFAVTETGGTATLSITIPSSTAPAATAFTWTGNADGSLWGTGGNWQGGSSPNAAGAVATFPDLDASTAIHTVTLSGAATVSGLSFTTTNGYTLTGGTLTLDNGGYADSTISSVAYATNTVASAIAGTGPISVNPVATNAGLVKLTGDKSAFSGSLTTGSGTTEIDSFAFVDSASDLTIGRGTLRYTGTGETLPGLSLNAGGYVSILDVENDLTLRSMSCYNSAFAKMGEGTLYLKGTGAFAMGNKDINYNANDLAGIGKNGDSPTSTFRSAMIGGGGRMVIGTVGDDTDAPSVTASGEFMIGSLLSGSNGKNEKGGELVMNNGHISSTYLGAGYYGGIKGNAPETVLMKYTQNGGDVTCSYFRTLQDQTKTQDAKAVITINGGTLTGGASYLNAYPGVHAETEWTQNGGTVTLANLTVGQNAASSGNAYHGATFTLNGGELRVTGTFRIADYSPSVTYLNEGATLAAKYLWGSERSPAPSSVLYARGGTFQGLVPHNSENSTIRAFTHFYLGEKGLKIDTSSNEAFNAWPDFTVIRIYQPMETEPGVTTDGGITVSGGGWVWFGRHSAPADFADSTFNGPITIEDGEVLVSNDACKNRTLVVKPGAAYRSDTVSQTIQNLTLGATGDTTGTIFNAYNLSAAATTNYCVVVTGSLQVLSPVTFQMHSVANYIEPNMAAGVYTALVFNAANSDVDTSLFRAPAKFPGWSVSAQQVTLSGGAYDGWKAIVATVSASTTPAAGDRVWTSSFSGGNWSASANWNGQEAPNGANDLALFNPASNVNVPVTLDTDVTVGTLATYATHPLFGYRLAGGSLTLTAPGTIARIVAASGMLTIDSPLTCRTYLNVSCPAGARIDINGTITSPYRIWANSEYQSGGGGTVYLKDTSGIEGIIMCRSGRLILDTLSGLTGAEQLKMGNSTVQYTGTGETIPGLSIGTGGGNTGNLQIDRDLTVRSVTGNGAWIKSGYGDLIFKGNKGFFLGNTTKSVGNANSLTESKIKENGDMPSVRFQAFDLAQGRVIAGTVDDANDAPVMNSSYFSVGSSHVDDTDCEFVMNNGTLTCSSGLYLGYYAALTNSCKQKFTLNGGTVTTPNLYSGQSGNTTSYVEPEMVVNGGVLEVSQQFRLGHQIIGNTGTHVARYTQNGGTVRIGDILYGVYADVSASGNANRSTDAILTLNGGTLTLGGHIQLSKNTNNKGTFWLNGGTLTAKNFLRYRGTGYVYFNGGTFVATAPASYDTMSQPTAVYVSTNGACIDTGSAVQGFYNISKPLLRDPALAAGDSDGGLIKLGKGLLHLSGANTYTGRTCVAGGKLKFSAQNGFSTPRVSISGDGSLDLGGYARQVEELTLENGFASQQVTNGTLTVLRELTLGTGEAGSADLYTTTNLTIAAGAKLTTRPDNLLCVDGDLTFGGATTLDFGMDETESIAYREKIALATFTGTCTAPAQLSPANIGANKGILTASVEGKTLYVTLHSGGTILSIR
ncbi:MAG: hypothetical protein IJR99_11350 [Kiritimatiellae bacterium]|nr:hypothetical protein [Kiritimatiellia bacterium]